MLEIKRPSLGSRVDSEPLFLGALVFLLFPPPVSEFFFKEKFVFPSLTKMERSSDPWQVAWRCLQRPHGVWRHQGGLRRWPGSGSTHVFPLIPREPEFGVISPAWRLAAGLAERASDDSSWQQCQASTFWKQVWDTSLLTARVPPSPEGRGWGRSSHKA